MIRVLFLILIVSGAAVLAQTVEQPRAVKLDEFETAASGYVKWRMDAFYAELGNNPAAYGYIVNYGTDREILIRERQIRVSINWRRFDPARITFVKGGFRDEVKTELWIVPPGAENPEPEAAAKKFDEFGAVSIGDIKARLQNLYSRLAEESPKPRAYILIYGPSSTIARRDALIKQNIGLMRLDPKLVTIKNAGYDKTVRTEFWLVPAEEKKQVKTEIYIVPPGAKPPGN